MTCSIDDCGKPVKARGLCNGHWKRLQKHGDPRAGKHIYGSALQFIETAVGHSGDDFLIWPFLLNANGYGTFRTKAERGLAHRALCQRVHGPAPDKHDAAHSCGNRKCMNPRHLRWATRADNLADRITHGTSNRGEQQGASKLKEEDVLAIRALEGIIPQKELAERFGVIQQTISDIQRGKRWAWLKGELSAPVARHYLEGLL